MLVRNEIQVRYDAYRAQKVFGSLDGLRFICIAMVLWHHGTIWTVLEDPASILTRGFAGVEFFFVLSGFLITTLLLREEARNGRFSVFDFYRRRALRILPVYFLAISSIGFWWIVVRGQDEWTPLLPYYYLFAANFLIGDIPLLAPMWSLAVEEQYYLVWPALLIALPAMGARLAVVALLVLVCLATSQGLLSPIEPVPPTDYAQFVLPMLNYMAILLGALTAMVLHCPAGFAVLWLVVGHRWAPVAALALTALALQFVPSTMIQIVVPIPMALTLAALTVREDHVAAPALKAAPIVRIGKVSYGLYIWHLVGLHIGNVAVERIGLTGWTGAWTIMGIYLITSAAIAELSYRYFEIWFLRLKNRRSLPASARRRPASKP